MSQSPFRDLVVALSLSNLLFLKGWIELLEGSRHPYFRRQIALYWADAVALTLDVLLLAAACWIAVLLARRSRKRFPLRLARWTFLGVFILLLFLVANVVRRRIPSLSLDSLAARLGKAGLIFLGVVVAVVVVLLLVRRHRSLVRVAVSLLLVFSPFVLITFSRAIWVGLHHSSHVPPAETSFMPEPPCQGRAASRVLWFVFDDMDYRLAISERPPSLHLPELDRLRGEVLSASHAYPPAPYTGRSMPALITGRRVSKATPARWDELMVLFEGTREAVGWSSQPNIFSQAREKGFRTGVIGWYHPYCRIFGASLTACYWKPFKAAESPVPVVKSMLEFVRQAIPPRARLDLLERVGIKDPDWDGQYHIATYISMLEEAKKVISDSSLDLVLVHWPIPHPPFIYDRERRDFTLSAHPRAGYLDNLALVDRTLGELRRTLEEAGLWNGTTLLLTSDHPWRDSKLLDGKRDARVPFVLKLSGHKEAVTYRHPFDMVLTKNLLLSLLAGELASPESVVQWLDQRGGVAPRAGEIEEAVQAD